MVFDHALFTLGYMFGHNFSREMFDALAYISPAFAATFVIICGISCTLSHNNFRRGTKTLVAAVAVTMISLVIMADSPIVFGILHLLGVCIMLYIPLSRFIHKLNPYVGIVLCAILFLLTYSVDNGYLGLGALSVKLPEALYESNTLMILGFRSPSAFYSDYFPLLPWVFAFMTGVFLGTFVLRGKVPKAMYKSRVPFFSMLGENAFLVYLAHQPLAYGLYYILSLIS